MEEWNGKEQADRIAEFVSQNSGKSEDTLMAQLKSMTDAEREAGGMDNTKLDEIYRTLYPFLTLQQRQKMEQVLARLKE